MKIQRDLTKDFIIDGKRKIRDILLNDEDIVELLKDDIPDDELAKIKSVDNPFIEYGYVMPYIFVPTVQTKESCYVCMKLDEEILDPSNPYVSTKYATFVLFCSPKRQNIEIGANRLDVLSYCIKDIFNWSNPLGSAWMLEEDSESVLTSQYIARTLDFRSIGVSMRNRSKTGENKINGKGMTTLNHTDLNTAIKRNSHGVEVYDDSDL